MADETTDQTAPEADPDAPQPDDAELEPVRYNGAGHVRAEGIAWGPGAINHVTKRAARRLVRQPDFGRYRHERQGG